MLQEMGVSVWLPESGVAVLERSAAPQGAAPTPAAVPASLPSTPASQRSTFVAAGQAAAAALAVTVAKPPAERKLLPTSVGQEADAGSDAALALESSPDWNVLTDSVRSCQACALCAGRSHTTLLAPQDVGHCDWLVLGDPPDEEEDRTGVPFAGAAGVLLHNMLRALGLQRANPDPALLVPVSGSATTAATTTAATRAYVSNVLKCRPAHGAVPQPAELAQCASHLQREIALVQPRMILSMGRFANQLLLAANPELASLPLGKLRGSVHSYQGTPVVVTYPPSLLLRNSADKAKAWADLCLAATTIEK